MANSSPNPFSADATSSSCQSAWAQQLLLQGGANAIALQPSFDTSAAPDFAAHLATAQGTASSYFQTGVPALAAPTAAVLGFANQLAAMYGDLLGMAEVLDSQSSTPAARTAAASGFCGGVALLVQLVTNNQPQFTAAVAALTALKARSGQDVAALNADLALATKGLNQGTVATLTAKLNGIRAALDADNATIAKGAVGGIGASVVIALGIAVTLGEPEEASEGIELIIHGIEMAGDVSADQQAAIADQKTQFDTFKATLASLVVAEAQFASIQSIAATVQTFDANVQATLNAAQAQSQAWAALLSNLNALVGQLESGPTTGLGLTAALTANTAWQTLAQQARQQQSYGLVPVVKSAL